MACLDTNVLIDLGNPRRPLHHKAVDIVADAVGRGEAVCTTRFNIAELLVGLERAADRVGEERRFRRATATLSPGFSACLDIF
jgi:predicted nucleic acid-binding protein